MDFIASKTNLLKEVKNMNEKFIEIPTDIGPVLFRKDLIAYVRPNKEDANRCIMYPTDGDYVRFGVLMSYEEMKKLITS